jgi:hypothetical protein
MARQVAGSSPPETAMAHRIPRLFKKDARLSGRYIAGLIVG